MKKFLVAVLMAASVAITGCSALGSTKLEQVQSVAQVAFLSQNYKEVKAILKALPTQGAETVAIDKGLAMFEVLRSDMAKLAKGDLETEAVLDYATGTKLHKGIAEAYNTIMVEGMRPFAARTGYIPSPQMAQFNRIGVTVWKKMGVLLETNQSAELKQFIGLLQLSFHTLSTLKDGKIPGVLLENPGVTDSAVGTI